MSEFVRRFAYPPEWKSIELSECAARVADRWSGNVDVPVLTISAQQGLVDQREYFKRRVASTDLSTYYELRRGDFAYNKSYSAGYPFGAISRLRRYERGVVSPLYICFRLTADHIHPEFVRHSFDAGVLDEQLMHMSKEGARNHGLLNVKVGDFFKAKLFHPRFKAQQRIAEILSTFEEALEQTEALIAKTQQVKAGLMHDLFTRGVTADGQLRSSCEEAPWLYKKSPLGPIPKEWDAPLLDTIATRGSGHTPSQSHPEYWNGGVKWLSLADSWRLDQIYVSETEKKISTAGLANSSAVLLPADTVVVSRDGSRLGKSGILGARMAVSQHFIAWTCGSDLDNIFLYWSLQYRKREFENVATGSTIPTIGLQFFRRFRIGCPRDRQEQKAIGQILLSVEQELIELRRAHEKLRVTKEGLMADLLTGRVSLAIADSTVSSEVAANV